MSQLFFRRGLIKTIQALTILAMIITLISSAGPVSAASTIGITLDINPPEAVVYNTNLTSAFALTRTSYGAYVLWKIRPYQDNTPANVLACRLYDLANGQYSATWDSAATTCNGKGVSGGYTNAGAVQGASSALPYGVSGITWNVGTITPKKYEVYIEYYRRTNSTTTSLPISDKYAAQAFLVTNQYYTITLQKFVDHNADGVYNAGDGDSLYTDTGNPVKLCKNVEGTETCTVMDGSGKTSYSLPAGFADDFYEDATTIPASWVNTNPNDFYTYTITKDETLYIGNAKEHLQCATTGVQVSAAMDPSHDITFKYNFEKLYEDASPAGSYMQVYFDNTSSPVLGTELQSSTLNGGAISPDSGDGSSVTPWNYTIGTVTGTDTAGYIDQKIRLTYPSGRPTSGSLVLNVQVGDGLDADTTNTTCSLTIPFTATAVEAHSFTAQPRDSGIQLGWWADAASANWAGFKLQSRTNPAAAFADVAGGYVEADLGALGGKDYAFLDTSAQPGWVEYQVVPVSSGGADQPAAALTLVTRWSKLFLPRLTR